MKTCEKCGTEVPEEKAFCPNCGAAMVAERKRSPEDSEEMIETLYGYEKPSKVLVLPPTGAATKEAQPPQPKPDDPRRQPSVMAFGLPESMPASTSTTAVSENRSSRGLAATLAAVFAVLLLVVAILYFTGRI